MNEKHYKTFSMVLSTKLVEPNQTLVICNKWNRDGKTIMKTLENTETLKLVIFYGNKQGFIPNTVYTFHRQENKPKCFSYFGLYDSCEKCLVARECEEKAKDLAEEYGLETSQDI